MDPRTRLMLTPAELENLEELPTQSNGEQWRYLLEGPAGIALTNTCGALIDLLIPGYGDLPDTKEGNEAALLQRYDFAVATAQHIQLMINVDATELSEFTPDEESEDNLTAIFAEKKNPYDGAHWEHPTVPLVLIATDYFPFVTTRVPPTGNVLWIDPSDELNFLTSLATIGYIGFHTQGEEPAETEADSVPV